MPIYEFNCAKCGKLTEVVQRVNERPPPCPNCGSKRMTLAVSRTSFHLKGGGWYADLYGTPRPGSDKAEGAEPAKSPEGKPAVSTKPEGAEKPAAPSAGAAVAKPEAGAKDGSSPPRRRPSSPRRRR
jgi:putative FmdB family regulatory protein